MKKRGKDLSKIENIVKQLALGKNLEAKFRDHSLGGEWKECRDCHIEPDWILIYSTNEKMLRLERTGTNSDLF